MCADVDNVLYNLAERATFAMQSHNFYSFYGHLAILTARNNVKLRKNDYLCALVQRDNTKVADGQCAIGHRGLVDNAQADKGG